MNLFDLLAIYLTLLRKAPLVESYSQHLAKAFDSIEHPFLLAVLKSFGFGPQFIHWVRTMFKNAECCVTNNGHSTGYFPLERGTRQGDPLPAYLYILSIETLFIQIRENEEVKRIRINQAVCICR